MANFVFRCDANPLIGIGHVMRCMSWAMELQSLGHDVAFAMAPGSKAMVAKLAKSNIRVIDVWGAYQKQIREISQAFKSSIDYLVVDHYGLDARFESIARNIVKRIVVIDDWSRPEHDCDFLLNPSPSAVETRLQGLPSACKLLLGPRYALLASRFMSVRAQAIDRRRSGVWEGKILIAFGGTDPANATAQAIESTLKADVGSHIDVVLGRAAPHLEGLLQRYSSKIKFHVDTEEMPLLMAQADVAIGAGGSSAWERCTVGLPTVILNFAENQMETADALAAAGCALNLGMLHQLADGDLPRAVRKISEDVVYRREMSEAAFAICDGRGIRRASALTANCKNISGAKISIRLAEPEDVDLVYNWQSDPSTRRYMRNSAIPAPDEHEVWFENSLQNPSRFMFIVCSDGQACGVLRLDKSENCVTECEISVLVDASFRGSGVGFSALKLARSFAPGMNFISYIQDENVASRRIFAKAGYIEIGRNLYRSASADWSNAAVSL